MQLNPIESEILQLVALHDGEWYWYQVDRKISNEGTYKGPFMKEIKALFEAGLMEQRPNPLLGGPPRYWLTEKGREKLEEQDREPPREPDAG